MYPEDILDEQDAEHLCAMGSMATKLAATAHEAKGAKTLEESVPAHYLEEFRGVFEKMDFDKLPKQRKWDHTIELKPGAEPVKGRNIPLFVPEQAELDVFIKEHVETGCICPSKSPWASLFFFVKKKDGKLRPVQDYQKLNSLTIKNRYPLPLISEIMHMLHKATWFTKLDGDTTIFRSRKEMKRRLCSSQTEGCGNHWLCSLILRTRRPPSNP
jgi:hypothetical protein